MTALDNLLKEIEALSQEEVNQILIAARIEAGKIEEENKKNIEAGSKEIIVKAKIAAKSLEERSISNRKIQHRNEVLMLKQNLIRDTVARARERLLKLPDPEYFSLLKSWAQQAKITEKADIRLNEKDLARNKGDFLTAFAKGTEISENPVDISGGFLAFCGGVTINCSADAVLEFHSEAINREVQRILFD